MPQPPAPSAYCGFSVSVMLPHETTLVIGRSLNLLLWGRVSVKAGEVSDHGGNKRLSILGSTGWPGLGWAGLLREARQMQSDLNHTGMKPWACVLSEG